MNRLKSSSVAILQNKKKAIDLPIDRIGETFI